MRKVLSLLGLFVFALIQTGCGSDDDEQLPLDYENVNKMIIGTWYVDDAERTLIFTEDGYYTDSSLSGTLKRQWKLEDVSEGNCYSYRLWLHRTYYDLEILSYDHWRLKDSEGVVCDMKRDGKHIDDDVSTGSEKLVCKITVYKGNSIEQTIKFNYGKNNRVVSADYSYSDEEPIIGPSGFHVFYNISGKTMTISEAYSGTSNIIETLPGKGILNDQGYVESQYFESNQFEINSGDYLIHRYEHNNKGQILSHATYDNPNTSSTYNTSNYEWNNGCITSFTGNPGGANYNKHPTYTSIENKANLNLNWMIFDQMFDEDVLGLALCGYISVKEKYLIDESVRWELDKQGIVTKATYKGYTYYIEYIVKSN